jgi:ATP citrate (pro-S)-lyase
MTILEKIQNGEDGILVLGNHPRIVQSILDFDYLAGKKMPSVVGIVTGNKKAVKCFFGRSEFLLPCYSSVSAVPKEAGARVRWMLNVQSGRRAKDSTIAFFDAFPDALGGHLFAENVPERHATELIQRYGKTKVIAGPSGVGFLVGGKLKLGAIGGIDAEQILGSRLTEMGSIAVVSTSGGMTNELIHGVAESGKGVSFALAIGGDRFPVISLTEVLAIVESDPNSKALAYFGELGGEDEYEIVELMKSKKFTKPVIAYIAGVIDEAFDEHMQFGHAKALVARNDESARAKREALRGAGAIAPDTFPEFLAAFRNTPGKDIVADMKDADDLKGRRPSILSTREVIDTDAATEYVKGGKVSAKESFSARIISALLGRTPKSEVTVAFADAVFGLLIDHGGNVSGAVNTMITARAGKDMVSALASGLLTIGPRFGGAINDGARNWLTGTKSGLSAKDYVEQETKAGRLILGIGHKKYRVGIPDPRVAALSQFATLLKSHPRYDFARAVEEVTTGKNGSLILNVDGVIAALFIDILSECEGYSDEEIRALIDAEFFNAFFIVPRTVGFIAHFLEQKENDEGLFRLPDDLLFTRKPEE